MKDGAHTHGSGGGAIIPALAVFLAAIIVASIAQEVIHLAALLLETALIIIGSLLGMAALGGIALAVWRLRHRAAPARTRPLWYARVPPAVEPAESLTEPRRTPASPGELHLHLHGLAAEQLAAILARVPRTNGGQLPPAGPRP